MRWVIWRAASQLNSLIGWRGTDGARFDSIYKELVAVPRGTSYGTSSLKRLLPIFSPLPTTQARPYLFASHTHTLLNTRPPIHVSRHETCPARQGEVFAVQQNIKSVFFTTWGQIVDSPTTLTYQTKWYLAIGTYLPYPQHHQHPCLRLVLVLDTHTSQIGSGFV